MSDVNYMFSRSVGGATGVGFLCQRGTEILFHLSEQLLRMVLSCVRGCRKNFDVVCTAQRGLVCFMFVCLFQQEASDFVLWGPYAWLSQ